MNIVMRWTFGLLAGLLFALNPWPGAWSQEKEPKASDTRRGSQEQQLRIAVREGRLSVELRDADVREVLAQIGHQAGIAIVDSTNVSRTISAQFTGMELEQGLRRLLELAFSSYSIVFAQGPAGAITIKEVHVLESSKRVQAPADGKDDTFAKPSTAEKREVARRFREAFQRPQQETPSAATETRSEAARRFREALQRSQKETPSAATETRSEAAARFRQMLGGAKQHGTGSPPPTTPPSPPTEK